MLENAMVPSMQRELVRRDAAEAATVAAHIDLLTQFLQASPFTVLPTPAWGKGRTVATMAEVVADDMDAALTAEFLSVVLAASTQPGVPPTVRMPAMALLSKLGKHYADQNCDDYAEGV